MFDLIPSRASFDVFQRIPNRTYYKFQAICECSMGSKLDAARQLLETIIVIIYILFY